MELEARVVKTVSKGNGLKVPHSGKKKDDK